MAYAQPEPASEGKTSELSVDFPSFEIPLDAS